MCKTYISQRGLAKRIGHAQATIGNRIREHGVKPDGILIQDGKLDCLLFEVERLPELRKSLGNLPVEANIR